MSAVTSATRVANPQLFENSLALIAIRENPQHQFWAAGPSRKTTAYLLSNHPYIIDSR